MTVKIGENIKRLTSNSQFKCMAKVEKTVLVPFSAAQMFTLVDDVTTYPEFLPWCGGIDLIKQDETNTTATIYIDYHGLKQQFTTENTKTKPTQMVMALKDGPFKSFNGLWQFTALSEEACKIEFMLAYDFSSQLLEKVISPVFSHIADTFVDGFVSRAEVIYKR